MKCPVCKQDMKNIRQDVSYNFHKNNKEYIRTLYQCSSDDIWVSTEIPKKTLKAKKN